MQGFVQIERCFIDHLEDLNHRNDSTDGLSDYEEEEEVWDQVDAAPKTKYRTAENMKEEEFDLIVISRRSRHRAGMKKIVQSSKPFIKWNDTCTFFMRTKYV